MLKSIEKSHNANLRDLDMVLRDLLLAEMKKRKMNQAGFAKLLGITPSYLSEILKGKKSGQRQGFQFLIKLGSIPNENKNNDFTCGWDEEVITACKEIKEIYESNNKLIISALKTNLAAFTDSVRKDNAIKKLQQDVKRLEMLHDPKQDSDTGKAATGIGPKKRVA